MKVLKKEQSINMGVPLKVEACGWEINNFILFSHSFPASSGPLLFSLHMTNEIGQIQFSFLYLTNQTEALYPSLVFLKDVLPFFT